MAKVVHVLALACALMAVVASAESSWGTRRMLIEGGRSVTVNGKRIYVNPSQVNATGCTDVSPDDQYTCTQQQSFGACNKDFMLAGNYCARTCKRCGFKVNPSQANATTCNDVSPDERYNCTQQRSFGACSASFMIRHKHCARTCGFPPCPAVANVTRSAAGNATIIPTAIATPNVTVGEEDEEAPTLLPVPEVPTGATNDTGGEGPEPVLTPVPLANATEPEPVVGTPPAPTVVTTPPLGASVAPAAADNATTVTEPTEPATGDNATVTVEPSAAAPATPTVVVTPPLAAQEPAAAAANATAPAVAAVQEGEAAAANATAPAVAAVQQPGAAAANATAPAVAAAEPAVGNATAAAEQPVAAANNATAAAAGTRR